ncbi:MAG: hypothetical protein KKF74_05380 [Nanoarchaeota archaeon]|nr:hypothetical protein [Nanoarchaeota archaeon]
MNFIPGSKYEKTIKDIVEFTKLEIKIFDDDFSEGYKKFKEEHLYHVNILTSCYKCLKPINGKSLVIEEQNDKITCSTYYFHEKCFDELIKK